MTESESQSTMSDSQTITATRAAIVLTSTAESNEYPKGFKFILPKPFKGDQSELEPWLFNMEEYFNNTNLSTDKWL